METTLFKRRDARIGVTLPQELRAKLDATAERESVNISVIVRLALVDYLKKLEAKSQKEASK